jgi:hypothetical protein
MFGTCSFCYAIRPGRLSPVPHRAGCPTGSRAPRRLDRDEALFFRHPDLVELDLAAAAWWPSAS